MNAKMDGVHTRTPQQLEQKLDIGKRFAEVMGVATDARNAAEEAQNAVGSLDSELTAEEIYNRLTNNGTAQGLFRDNEGNLFVNADYIYALEKLFAKNVTISAEVFLEPGQEEIETIQKHLLGTEIIPVYDFPLYDFNNDGKITILDMARAQKAALGLISLADWSGAVKSTVAMTLDMSNPDKFIRIQGTNMWGRNIDKFIGVNGTNIRDLEIADFIVESGTDGIWTYRKWNSGIAECWAKSEGEIAVNTSWANQSALYYGLIGSFNYPITFTDKPIVSVDLDAQDSWCNKYQSTITETGNIYAVGPVNKTEQYTLNIMAKGKWK